MTTIQPELRDRYNQFIADHEVAWELVTAALAAAFVVVGLLADAAPDLAGPLLVADVGLTAILAAEFATRITAARDRRAYLRGHWIDAVAIVPTVRGLRILRLLRLLRLVRTFAGVYRALMSFQRLATHRTLVALFIAWLAVAGICSTALYLAEVGVNPNIDDPTDALWWGVVTLTTVGYGDIFPVTPEGRIAAGALMILGITLWAAITGTITSFLITAQGGGAEPAERLRILVALRAEGAITDQEFQEKRAEVVARL